MRRRRKERDRDLERELRNHLDLEADEQRETGLSEEDARYAARRAFGNATRVKETVRELWEWTWLRTIWDDLRYTVRILRKNPGFTTMVITILALGIGANTAIFTVVNAVVLKMLPIPDPEQLVLVGTASPVGGAPRLAMPYPAYLLFRDHNDVFSSTLAYAAIDVNVRTENSTEPANGLLVSGSYWESLGVSSGAGRLTSPADDSAGRRRWLSSATDAGGAVLAPIQEL
jgi:hypothetical protein